MRNVGLAVGILVGVCVSPGMIHAATPLDGTRWQITITPDAAAKKAGEKPSKDALIFQGGQMTSTACVKYGFAPSSYTTAGTAASPSFQTEQASAKEGKMTWSGQVAGNTISGTAVWAKKNGQVLNSTFTGKKKAKVS